jgi:DNA-binding transcriptional regulator YiaG
VSLRSKIEAGQIKAKAQVFEDEADLLKQEMASKAKYRELYQSLLKVQGDIDAMREKCAMLRAALLSSFEEWHRKWERNELYPDKVAPPKTEADVAPTGKDFGKTKSKTPVRPTKPKPQPRGRK